MIIYKKMSVLDAPDNTIVVHAVNCEGLWNSGVAAQLKEYCPFTFERYETTCKVVGDELLGDISISFWDDNFWVANLYTSLKDSKNPDSEDDILLSTTTSLYKLFKHNKHQNRDYYMPKINSGAFNVPWEKTEKIVKILSDRYNVKVIVCELGDK